MLERLQATARRQVGYCNERVRPRTRPLTIVIVRERIADARNVDVIDLYERVKVGTKVVVI